MWIPRDIASRLKRSAHTRPVLGLTGARQTGKTSTFRRLMGKQVGSIPSGNRAAFQWYSWPGNIRELAELSGTRG